MNSRMSKFALLAVLSSVLAPAPSGAGERAVKVPPALEQQWLAQLMPGSGAVVGYQYPILERPASSSSGVRLGLTGTFVAPPAPQPDLVRPVPQEPVAVVRRPARVAVAAVPVAEPAGMDPMFLPQDVAYSGPEAPGTIVINPASKFLYLVEGAGRARRYGVGVGKPGFGWHGTHPITRKAEWPGWTPPAEMIARERLKGRILPAHMEGGEANPLGARAMYLGSTLYRIHGTNAPWTIGHNVSSGCIRMRNQDVMELYDRVKVGTKVVVL